MRRNSPAAAAGTRRPECARMINQWQRNRVIKQQYQLWFLASASKVSLAATVTTATTASDAVQAIT